MTRSRPGPLLLGCALGFAAMVLLVAGASSASAATVSMQSGVLTVSEIAGERNAIAVDVARSTATVTDRATSPVAGAGCASAASNRVRCQLGDKRELSVELGGEDDMIANDSALASIIHGGRGDDRLVGGSGRDRLIGDEGFDTLEGRAGDDRASTRGRYIDRVTCGAGNDSVQADVRDVIAEDCEEIERADAAGASPEPGAPPAIVVPAFAPDACTVLSPTTGGNHPATSTTRGDVMQGSPGNDRLVGGAGDDCLFGEEGDDELLGEHGNDFLSGGGSRDLLLGGEGADRLGGNAGADRLDGGGGADQAAGNSGRDTIAGGPGGDLVHGGSGLDVLDGGAGDDVLEGGTKADRIRAGKGANRLSGGRGDDLLIARNRERDRIFCGRGVDTVRADRRDRVAANCERVSVRASI